MGNDGRSLGPASSRWTAADDGFDPPEVAVEHELRQLGEGARELHPRGAAPDDDEGEQRLAPLRARLPLGELEGDEDALADVDGIAE